MDYQPINLSFDNNDVHSMKAHLSAGKLANIETRAINEGDHICRNEEVWYRPLSKVDHAMPAYSLAHNFSGEGLGTKWSNPYKRSAFVARSSRIPSSSNESIRHPPGPGGTVRRAFPFSGAVRIAQIPASRRKPGQDRA